MPWPWQLALIMLDHCGISRRNLRELQYDERPSLLSTRASSLSLYVAFFLVCAFSSQPVRLARLVRFFRPAISPLSCRVRPLALVCTVVRSIFYVGIHLYSSISIYIIVVLYVFLLVCLLVHFLTAVAAGSSP